MQTTKAKAVLYVVRPVAGGIREHVTLLTKYLDRKKFNPFVILAADDMLAVRLRDMDIEPWILPEVGSVDPISIIRTARKVSEIVRSGGVSLVHSHGYRAALGGGVGALLAGVPHIATIHTELGGKREIGLMGRLLQRMVAFLSRCIIIVSEEIAGSFGRHKIRLVHNGVEIEPLRPKSFRIGERQVGMVGRLSPEKGVDLFLEAAALMKERIGGVRFVVVGEGPLRAKLEKLSESLDLSAITTFTGFVDGAREMLDSIDVLVLPSRSEGQPMVLLESLAVGCPVVATDVGGVRELLDGGCGVVVPPEDPEAIASAVVRLLEEPESVSQIVKLGRRRVEEHYSAEKMAERTMEVYREAFS